MKYFAVILIACLLSTGNVSAQERTDLYTLMNKSQQYITEMVQETNEEKGLVNPFRKGEVGSDINPNDLLQDLEKFIQHYSKMGDYRQVYILIYTATFVSEFAYGKNHSYTRMLRVRGRITQIEHGISNINVAEKYERLDMPDNSNSISDEELSLWKKLYRLENRDIANK